MSETGQLDAPSAATAGRYRLNRAGIHNVWQYDDQVFEFAEGRLLLRGRNGAGKSKAVEVLLPFLLDGDTRRLDTSGSGRTNLRWLMLDGRPARTDTGADDLIQGYSWVEFVRPLDEGGTRRITLGACLVASYANDDVRTEFFVTEQGVGEELRLLDNGRPMPSDRLRQAVGQENCYTSAAAYRARVMGELFGMDDPQRYRNLIHLLYRLRRPTIGERLEAGELTTVLAEALPPTDDMILDTVGRNLADLEAARSRLAHLKAASGHVAQFLADYRSYLHGTFRSLARSVRRQLDLHETRSAEVDALSGELAELLARESEAQEARDRAHRTRDTAAADSTTLTTAAEATPAAPPEERRSVVGAHIHAARSAAVAADHAQRAENQALAQMQARGAQLAESLSALRGLHYAWCDALREAGCGHQETGNVPQPDPVVLVPRESTTHVDLEGFERAVERDPVVGVDAATVRGGLAELAEVLDRAEERLAEHRQRLSEQRSLLSELREARIRADALRDEAEWAQESVRSGERREREAAEQLAEAGTHYMRKVRDWGGRLRGWAEDDTVAAALAEVEDRLHGEAESNRLGADNGFAKAVEAIVAPFLDTLRERRDIAVGEARELATELDDLIERRESVGDHVPPPARADSRASSTDAFYLALEFADGVSPEEQAGLEGALEASGLLTARITPTGTLLSPEKDELLVQPRGTVTGPTLLDVLQPAKESGLDPAAVTAVLGSVRLRRGSEEEPEGVDTGPLPPPAVPAVGRPECAMATDGGWRLGVLSGRSGKSAPEYIGERARAAMRERHLANLQRRIAIAEALLAEARERCSGLEDQTENLAAELRHPPDASGLASSAATAVLRREDVAAAAATADAAFAAAEHAQEQALDILRRVEEARDRDGIPAEEDGLDEVSLASQSAELHLRTLRSDLTRAHVDLGRYETSVGTWWQQRTLRTSAEDRRTQAIQAMISVRRSIELGDRVQAARPEQLAAAQGEVRQRRDEAAERLPELRRAAQQARDDRIAAETRLAVARREQAAQVRRVHEAAVLLAEALRAGGGAGSALDTRLRDAAGLSDTVTSELLAALDGGPGFEEAAAGLEEAQEGRPENTELADTVDAVRRLVAALEADVAEEGEVVDDSALLRRHDTLRRRLAEAGPGARCEVSEAGGVKRVTVHDERGAHDVSDYAARLREGVREAEETARVREEEAYERHLLGDLAEHLGGQIRRARELIAAMNAVLGEVTTSQGLGVRLQWKLAADANEDIAAAVELVERPVEGLTRLERTRLRDALRRSIEAIRKLDPGATQGAQLRAALDYRAWFEFVVHVTDEHGSGVERRLSRRTGLSQGEQRVVAYLVLFAAAAAHFAAVAREAAHAPRFILLDDAFAKVDEPTHGKLLGQLVALDLDFVLTSERMWGCFPTMPSLRIYECLRDPAVAGIATVRFTWDGHGQRLQGD